MQSKTLLAGILLVLCGMSAQAVEMPREFELLPSRSRAGVCATLLSKAASGIQDGWLPEDDHLAVASELMVWMGKVSAEKTGDAELKSWSARYRDLSSFSDESIQSQVTYCRIAARAYFSTFSETEKTALVNDAMKLINRIKQRATVGR